MIRSTQVSVLYTDAGPPTGKYILQHCIRLNIPEPLGLLLAGESVEELELDWKDAVIRASNGFCINFLSTFRRFI